MASGDTALWLHNKLGSTDDLWSGRTICSQLSRDKLQSIQGCFHSLQPHVKVKLMLSFLHIPRRNVEEWKEDLEEILLMALNDTDQWVSTVAEILHSYPKSGMLSMELEENRTFPEVLADLRKYVKKTTESRMLPMECQFLNRNALVSVAGQQPQPIKHFALKRKPKSAALRVELLQKSTEYANNKKNSLPNTLPLKVRSFAKKMDDTTPLRGISNRTPSSSGFRSPGALGRFNSSPLSQTPAGGNRSAPVRKGVGIKLLDITEQPVGAKEAKRRRKQAEMEAIEQHKKEKEAAAAATVTATTTTQSFTPDYAAGLILPSPATKVLTVTSGGMSALSTGPVYLPNNTYDNRISVSAENTLPSNILSAGTQQARDNLQQQLQHQLTQSKSAPALGQPVVHPSPNVQPRVVAVSAATTQQQQQQAAPKKGLSLTREQMLEAQEMFRTSNKVTRPEKALILGFMAGSRDNPCPQQGDTLNIRLSENMEKIINSDNTEKEVMVDSFFQMNYSTGEWKRIKKFREITS